LLRHEVVQENHLGAIVNAGTVSASRRRGFASALVGDCLATNADKSGEALSILFSQKIGVKLQLLMLCSTDWHDFAQMKEAESDLNIPLMNRK
jgi:hypothetical protein